MDPNPVLENLLGLFLKKIGYEKVDKKAFILLKEVFICWLNSKIGLLSFLASHSGRTKLNFFDFFNTEVNHILLSELDIILSNYEHEVFPEQNEWKSSISHKNEKFIHIYEFMPDFPPIHTYRNTMIKENNTHVEINNIKDRMKQSIRSEKNMFKLFKVSGSLPPFINCIYNNENVFKKK
ncbi:hypothetical protein EHP00_945 [Ecytonucleospora hepatopenaei]|uniref:Transcription factor TFIID subunit 8 C-terminal domain-containing protein n=1 Tax=Ecytonucleospora hepatopenaei TaxID=646526 RepID=A0A1W0E747_9MICR|nr:hypothetical protein EHP00_945 [Ecytonucleospora hepatopenaei]